MKWMAKIDLSEPEAECARFLFTSKWRPWSSQVLLHSARLLKDRESYMSVVGRAEP